MREISCTAAHVRRALPLFDGALPATCHRLDDAGSAARAARVVGSKRDRGRVAARADVEPSCAVPRNPRHLTRLQLDALTNASTWIWKRHSSNRWYSPVPSRRTCRRRRRGRCSATASRRGSGCPSHGKERPTCAAAARAVRARAAGQAETAAGRASLGAGVAVRCPALAVGVRARHGVRQYRRTRRASGAFALRRSCHVGVVPSIETEPSARATLPPIRDGVGGTLLSARGIVQHDRVAPPDVPIDVEHGHGDVGLRRRQ